ncbi:hypothetical protein [Streptomyces erythrochromogenes]
MAPHGDPLTTPEQVPEVVADAGTAIGTPNLPHPATATLAW